MIAGFQEKVDNKVVAHLGNGRTVQAEMLLFAAGRMGSTDSLGLEALELESDHRGRVVRGRGARGHWHRHVAWCDYPGV